MGVLSGAPVVFYGVSEGTVVKQVMIRGIIEDIFRTVTRSWLQAARLQDEVRAIERNGPRILLVDDDKDLLQLIALRLRAAGYSVRTAESAEAALASLSA